MSSRSPKTVKKHSPKTKKPLTGVIRVTAGAFGFIDQGRRPTPTKPSSAKSAKGFSKTQRKSGPKKNETVFIPPGALNTALDGDEVEYVMTRGDNGEVLKVLKRARTEFVSQVTGRENGFLIVKPDNPKFYTDLVIEETAETAALSIGAKIVARLKLWPKSTLRPGGDFIKNLGQSGEHETEMQAIIQDRGLIEGFSVELETEAQKIAQEHNLDAEIKKRKDFREVTTFTIDPLAAKDFDDALSIRQTADGLWEVGIHIADVSHYLTPGSLLDLEAQKRATSIYLVDRTIPMLPKILSDDLCSLVPHENRLTFSAVFEMDDKANIKSEWFGRTVIKSDRRFTYEEAHKIIETNQGEYAAELRKLDSLAKELDRQKISAGALAFEEDEVSFEIDALGKPLNVFKRERLDTHKLVEDFMLLANKKVAEHVSRLAKNQNGVFVYRVHDAPDPDKLDGVRRFINLFGHKLTHKGSRPGPQEINNFLKKIAGQPEESVITREIIRSMSRAVYSTKNIGHFGLAFAHYTHFTSPIRRYPDVMVHRLLDTYLKGQSPAKDLLLRYDKLCDHSSSMEKLATDAERESVKYKQAEYLENHLGEVFDGVISSLTKWGMYVEELSTGAEGLIRYREMAGDRFIFEEKKFQVRGEKTNQIYRLGGLVKIKVAKTDRVTKTIDFTLDTD
ncbi:MAG TPA: ribonuclease R [Candidatus Paceibacterota bacterium]|nr:ribonuclease R [Candidatus Paceibacterota bacterium]HPY12786.1 ribonuclease R [Candidatus Paceibacterota bacterium]HQB26773.1 ribonuclease R [Candidatus Paceibacterota bacterium]